MKISIHKTIHDVHYFIDTLGIMRIVEKNKSVFRTGVINLTLPDRKTLKNPLHYEIANILKEMIGSWFKINEMRIIEDYVVFALENHDLFIFQINWLRMPKPGSRFLRIEEATIVTDTEKIGRYIEFLKAHELREEDVISVELVKIDQRGEIVTTDKLFKPRFSFEDIRDFYVQIPEIEHVVDFLSSNGNLLYLLGKPGTGKTRLIEGLLATWEKDGFFEGMDFSVTYVLNSEALLTPDFWSDIERKLIIVDDADVVLGNRDDNDRLRLYISNILRVSDSLLYDMVPKIVFISNLKRYSIDEALLRSGRVFRYYEFGAYTLKEAIFVFKRVGEFLNITETEMYEDKFQAVLRQKNDITLADIFDIYNSRFKKVVSAKPNNRPSIGFVAQNVTRGFTVEDYFFEDVDESEIYSDEE